MKKPLPCNLILLGDIASGKGTQAARLARRFKLYDLDMGRETRSPRVKKLYDFGRTSGKGILTPTRIVRSLFRKRISETPPSTGILFDGTPKMIGEAKFVARELQKAKRRDPLAIYLSIPMQESLKRTRSRIDTAGGKKARRDDDRPEAIRNRVRYYRTQIKKVTAFFRSRYRFKKISGLGTREQVYKRLVSHIERELKRPEVDVIARFPRDRGNRGNPVHHAQKQRLLLRQLTDRSDGARYHHKSS